MDGNEQYRKLQSTALALYLIAVAFFERLKLRQLFDHELLWVLWMKVVGDVERQTQSW